VEFQLGLPIFMKIVIRVSSGDLVSLCEQLLEFVPPTTTVKENLIKLSLLGMKPGPIALD